MVVTHDSCEDLLACLASLDDVGADEVVVVDSGSRDRCLPTVAERHPSVRTLRLANVGFGQAANAGVARTSAPIVVVANADTRFRPGSLTALAAAMGPDTAVVGPRVVYPDGRPQASARRFPSLPVAAGHAAVGLWWPDNPWTRQYRGAAGDREAGEVDWVSGCVVALRRDAFEAIGGFDPAYFMFVEDVDLAWRLRQAGWTVRYEPSAEVVHRVGASTGHYGGTLALEHARSLHRFWSRAYGRGPTRLLDPLVRIGLAAWAAMAWIWQRAVAPRTGRSTTGE